MKAAVVHPYVGLMDGSALDAELNRTREHHGAGRCGFREGESPLSHVVFGRSPL
jgi:hypothetical protein